MADANFDANSMTKNRFLQYIKKTEHQLSMIWNSSCCSKETFSKM